MCACALRGPALPRKRTSACPVADLLPGGWGLCLVAATAFPARSSCLSVSEGCRQYRMGLHHATVSQLNQKANTRHEEVTEPEP
ncbi:hypothetical protein LEMLEM_LOCUS26602 [Lemmus lemmus]